MADRAPVETSNAQMDQHNHDFALNMHKDDGLGLYEPF